jgi:hypothetical protein
VVVVVAVAEAVVAAEAGAVAVHVVARIAHEAIEILGVTHARVLRAGTRESELQ